MFRRRSSRPAFHSRKNLAGFELITAGVVIAEKRYVFRKREVPKEVREEEGSKKEELRRGRVIRGALIESSSSHPLLWAYERLESKARKKVMF